LIIEFYFKQFNSNLKSITFDFLVNDRIVRIKTERKRMLNIVGVPKVSRKIYFDLLTLKIMYII
jgi:hypothetical protein